MIPEKSKKVKEYLVSFHKSLESENFKTIVNSAINGNDNFYDDLSNGLNKILLGIINDENK